MSRKVYGDHILLFKIFGFELYMLNKEIEGDRKVAVKDLLGELDPLNRQLVKRTRSRDSLTTSRMKNPHNIKNIEA